MMLRGASFSGGCTSGFCRNSKGEGERGMHRRGGRGEGEGLIGTLRVMDAIFYGL